MSKFILTCDASQIKQFQTCPLSWYYQYKENLRLPGLKMDTAPDKGTLIHDLCDIYYNLRALNLTSDFLINAQATVDLIQR
ncbi:MAG: PD-(D/E)XK nuclease family protein, partial [Nanoarchaeota archaeon]